MSDTPRTDERDHDYTDTPWNNWVESAFARTLEREIAAVEFERGVLDRRMGELSSEHDRLTGELTAWAVDALNCRQAIYKLIRSPRGSQEYQMAVEYAEMCLRMGKAKGDEQ